MVGGGIAERRPAYQIVDGGCAEGVDQLDNQLGDEYDE